MSPTENEPSPFSSTNSVDPPTGDDDGDLMPGLVDRNDRGGRPEELFTSPVATLRERQADATTTRRSNGRGEQKRGAGGANNGGGDLMVVTTVLSKEEATYYETDD